MQRTKRILMTVGVGLALAGGGVGIAAASGSSAAAYKPAQAASSPTAAPTINVTTATVGGQVEPILVDAQGLPLYTFGSDTSTKSHVTGGLAALWPPVVTASPSEAGATGKLTVVANSFGEEVQYNGHFLYTFVDDTPGQVTGQGVQGFNVATPDLGSGTSTSVQAPAPSRGGSYNYSY